MKKYPSGAAAAALAAALALASCDPARDSSLKLPPTPPLSGGLGWALSREAYVRLKAGPSRSARDLAHLRKGGVFEIEARELGDPSSVEDRGLWLKLKAEDTEGWAREAELDSFPSRAQADRAATAVR